MGNATTFAELAANPSSEKVFLAEIRLSELIQTWTKADGYTYVYQKAYLTDTITLVDGRMETIRKTIVAVRQNTVDYTAVASIALVEATASSFYHDTANGVLYIHTSNGTAPAGFTIMGFFWLYFATKGLALGAPYLLDELFNIINDEDANRIITEADIEPAARYYEPYLAANGIPRITQAAQSLRYGVVTVGSGAIEFINADGYFDQIVRLYVWAGSKIKVLLGGDALPYAEYTTLFQGKINNPKFTNLKYSISVKSISYDLLRSLPVNNFWSSAYPHLDPVAQGANLPLYYGSYDAAQAPLVTCIDTAYGASTYQFKICDTTYWPIKSITQVYVDYGDGAGWQTIAHANEDLGAATFTINTASFIVGTSRVKVAFEGYHNAGTLIEGAPEIAEDLLTTWCGLTAADLDSAAFTASKTASTCVLNVPIEAQVSALTIIEQICASDIAFFSDNAAGQLRYVTWVPQPGGIGASPELTKDDIWNVQFEDDLGSLYWRARIGYAYQAADQKYLYAVSDAAESKYKYGRNESITINSYLRGSADADDLAYRINLWTKDLLTTASFSMSIGEIDALIGDMVRLTLSRAPFAEPGGQEGWPYEIIAKEISAFPAQITFKVRELPQFARNMGYWMADDAPTWLLATPEERLASGFWTDDDGYADPSGTPDEASKNTSLWW